MSELVTVTGENCTVKSFKICTSHQVLLGRPVMGGACSTHSDTRNAQGRTKIWLESLKGRDQQDLPFDT
jgi:hypothetical protein